LEEHLKQFNLSTFIIFTVIVLVFTVTGFFAGTVTARANGQGPQSSRVLDQLRLVAQGNLVDQTLRQLKHHYFMDIDTDNEKKLMYGAVSGMMNELRQDPFSDEFSHFYDPELYKDLEAQTTGEYPGIGILMGMSSDGMYPEVVTVFDNTSAMEVGMQKEDIITKIGDKDAFGMYLPQVATLIRGEPGTKVELEVYRPSDNEFFNFTVERRNVEYSSVSKIELKPGNVGYIELSTFADQTAKDFNAAMVKLQGEGMKSLVIDLRGNTGGLFNAACEVADLFITKDMKATPDSEPGVLVTVEQRVNGKLERQAMIASEDGPKYKLPIVILAGPSTASSSEILTGALRDYGLAKVVGETTFGKGVVQAVNPLEYEGEKAIDALAITIGKYYTPAGHDLHRIGIDPDIWYDWDSQLKEDSELQQLNDVAEKKRDELLELRAQVRKYLREHDMLLEHGAQIADKLAKGEKVPDVPKPAEKEEKHLPIEAAQNGAGH
jgi:carboxyl-terminal processing protease